MKPVVFFVFAGRACEAIIALELKARVTETRGGRNGSVGVVRARAIDARHYATCSLVLVDSARKAE